MTNKLSGVELKIARAYTQLICMHPFFAVVLMRLERIMADCIVTPQGVMQNPTMCTDGRRLIMNPEFTMNLPDDELIGVLAHEVMHVVGLHPWRRGTRDPYAWNIACDGSINHIVQGSGLKLPAGCVPGVDKSAEELYVHPPEQGEGKQGDQPGQGPGQDPGGCGGVFDPSNDDGSAQTEAQRSQGEGEAKIMVQQALNAAKRAGTLPAGLERYAQDMLEPRVPWREVLSRFLDGQARSDYSWSRPNRRYVSAGIMFPSLWSPAYGTIAMGCDTSGSVGAAELKEVCSEVIGALELYAERGQEPEVDIAWFDTQVHVQTVSAPDDLLQPKGGGGTSFRAVMEWVVEKEVPPKALVMVTDGECHDFGEDPGVPVLWVLTTKPHGFEPPFGEITCVLNG